MSVTLHGERDFADIIKIRMLNDEIALDYQVESNVILSQEAKLKRVAWVVTPQQEVGGMRRKDHGLRNGAAYKS